MSVEVVISLSSHSIAPDGVDYLIITLQDELWLSELAVLAEHLPWRRITASTFSGRPGYPHQMWANHHREPTWVQS